MPAPPLRCAFLTLKLTDIAPPYRLIKLLLYVAVELDGVLHGFAVLVALPFSTILYILLAVRILFPVTSEWDCSQIDAVRLTFCIFRNVNFLAFRTIAISPSLSDSCFFNRAFSMRREVMNYISRTRG